MQPAPDHKSIRSTLGERIGQLLAGPRDPHQWFVLSKTTYGELYGMAAQIRESCGSQTSVCLCTQDRAMVAAALLAALAGGPALVLPYAFDTPVIDELLRRTGSRIVVSDHPKALPAGTACFVPAPGIAVWPPAADVVPREADTPWVRLFTGGSTGAPKIWTKTVRNLMAETLSIIDHYQVTAADRIVATVAPNHIYGLLYSILTPLLASAAVAPQTPSFPGEIQAAVGQSAATLLISVPAHYRALNGHPFKAPSLRTAFSSAGMLAQADADAFVAQTNVPVVEVYGSTETGGIAERIRAQGDGDFKPFPPVKIQIQDHHLRLRSDYLSPELAIATGGYFELGDRVRATAGDRFELLGRNDGIVKVGGQRVDLEAVRQTLKQNPGVKDAVAISLPVGSSRENQIVALVEADAASLHVSALALEPLAHYARPRRIKMVAKIPLTAAGKYDRQAIVAIFQTGDR